MRVKRLQRKKIGANSCGMTVSPQVGERVGEEELFLLDGLTEHSVECRFREADDASLLLRLCVCFNSR